MSNYKQFTNYCELQEYDFCNGYEGDNFSCDCWCYNSVINKNEITQFLRNEVWTMRLRDGRNIYCDDDGRWFLSGHPAYYDKLEQLLNATQIHYPNLTQSA